MIEPLTATKETLKRNAHLERIHAADAAIAEGQRRQIEELAGFKNEARGLRDHVQALETRLAALQPELETARRQASDAAAEARRLAHQIEQDSETVAAARAITATLHHAGLLE